MAVWIDNISILTFSIKIIKTDISAKFEGSQLFLFLTTVKAPVIWSENYTHVTGGGMNSHALSYFLIFYDILITSSYKDKILTRDHRKG